jgi:hypothetical protein
MRGARQGIGAMNYGSTLPESMRNMNRAKQNNGSCTADIRNTIYPPRQHAGENVI